MTGLTCRLVVEEDGHGPLAYALVTGVLSVLVFRPELAVAVVYRLGTFSAFSSPGSRRCSESRSQTDPFLKSFLTGLLPQAESGKHRHPSRNHKPQAQR